MTRLETEWLDEEGMEVRDLIVQRAKKAGIKKRVYPHLFRHSRATHLANVLTEAQMREFFGWSKNSDVPSKYVHLNGRDVDRTLLEHYDYDVEEMEEVAREESLKPASCLRYLDNPPGSKFCNQCGMALTDEAAILVEEKRERTDKIQEMFNE